MGIFSGAKKGVSKKPVAEWGQEQVLRWLAHLGKEKHADQFKAVSGKRLLQLSADDLAQLVGTRLEAELLLDAILELRAREGLAEAPAQPQAGEPAAAGGSAGAAAAEPPAGPTALGGHALPPVRTGAKSSAASAATSRSHTPLSSVAVTPSSLPAAQGPRESAAALSGLVGNHVLVGELFEYMSFLGIQGMGLVEATQRTPTVGHVIGALWELHDLATGARGSRANCLQLDAYGQDILRVFDAEGKRLAFIQSDALAAILGLVELGITIVEGCCRPGWLVRMATTERSMEGFQAVHNGILEHLRAEKIDTLPNGRQLTYGEYRDSSRPLRRCLKQLGQGSPDAGLAAALKEEAALAEVAQLIGVEPQAVLRDLQHTSATGPELDLLSTQTHSSVSGSGGGEYSPMSPVAARSREYQTIFSQYDKNRSGALEFEELRSVLADLGLLEGVKPTEIDALTLQHYAAADADGDGLVGFDEFVAFYQSLSTTRARRHLRAAMGPQAEKDLKKIFHSFASFGIRQHAEELDGARFSKLCRDCKLLSRAFTTIDCDLVFAKTKAKGQRRIDFEGFLSALGRVAEKKGQGMGEVVRQILMAGGPTVTGTRAEYVKLHDNKSTYTGVYSRGGPTNVEPSRELSHLLDRSEADVRGVKKRASSGGGEAPLSARGPAPAGPNATPRGRRLSSSGGSDAPLTARGRRESSGNGEPSRLRRASGAGEPPPRARGGGSSSGTPKSLEGSAFADSSSMAATAGDSSVAPTAGGSSVAATAGGSSAGLTAGGSSAAATTGDSSAALTAGGSSTAATAGGSSGSLPLVSPRAPSEGSFCAPGALLRLPKEPAAATPPKAAVPRLALAAPSTAELRGAFESFCRFGGGPAGPPELDGPKWAKLCRECGLLQGRVDAAAADLVFSRVKPKGARRLGYREFVAALDALAAERGEPAAAMQARVAGAGGPKRSGTTPAGHVRLHDDKAAYTGVYKAGGPSVVDKHQVTLESLTDRTNTATPRNRPRMQL